MEFEHNRDEPVRGVNAQTAATDKRLLGWPMDVPIDRYVRQDGIVEPLFSFHHCHRAL